MVELLLCCLPERARKCWRSIVTQVSLQESSRDLITSAGGSVQTLVADITDEEQDWKKLASITCLDDLDPSISCTTMSVSVLGMASVNRLEREVWEQIFNVNVTGMYLTCKHVIPALRANGGGAIVNVSSIAAVATTPLDSNCSKAAVNALTQNLAAANFDMESASMR